MNIFYLTHSLNSKSGWARYASDLVRGVKEHGNKAEVFLSRGGTRGFLRTLVFGGGRMKKCDIIHALDVYPYGVMAYLANLVAGKPLIVSAQGTYAIEPLYMLKTKFLSARACRAADAVVAISNFTKGELLKKVKLENISVINHGIDLSLFYQEHVPSGERFILSVGALKYRKGYHVSISAFALAKKKFPDLKYKIVGEASDTNYFNQLKALAKQEAIAGDIEFISEVSGDELKNLYRKAKVFLLTSVNVRHSFEGFGLVFLEAAAAGLPVIGTLGTGIEDAVQNGYNGILVKQNDIRGTAEAISSILENEDKWRAMSQNSHQWAQDHSLEKTIKQYIGLYERILHLS